MDAVQQDETQEVEACGEEYPFLLARWDRACMKVRGHGGYHCWQSEPQSSHGIRTWDKCFWGKA